MERKPCPFCGEEIAVAAKKCRYCGEWLEESAAATQTCQQPEKSEESLPDEPVSPTIEDPVVESADDYINEDNNQGSHDQNNESDTEDSKGKIYHIKKSERIILLSLAGLCLILAICTFNVPFKFDLFFNTLSYTAGFGCICLLLLLAFAFTFGEQRDGKVYLTKDGKLDIETPRSYEALKKPAFLRYMGRSNKFKGEGLERFAYEDGTIYILTTKGRSIHAPLSELTWKYGMIKPNDGGIGLAKWYIHKYEVTDSEGNSIKFYRNNATFEDDEWDDINMLLSLSGTVDERKASKAMRKMTKVLEKVNELDFSDILDSSAATLVADGVYAGSNKVIDMVKVKLYGKNKKKRSPFWEKVKKIWNWILIGALALYVLAVIVYNTAVVIEYYFGKTPDSTEQIVDSDYVTADDYENMDDNEQGQSIYHLTGMIDGKYGIDMTLDFNSHSGSYYYTKYSPDNRLRLEITEVTEDGKIIIHEYNDDNDLTGIFDGQTMSDGIKGRYTNYQGREMPFYIKLDGAGDKRGSSLLGYIESNADKSLYGTTPAYYYSGYFTDGRNKYPVEFVFINYNGDWSVVYKNLNGSETKLDMEIAEVDEDEMRLVNSQNHFIVTLNKGYDGSLSGEAEQYQTTLDVKLSPKDI